MARSAVTTHHITRVAINYEGPHPHQVLGLAAAGGGDSAVRGRGGRAAGVPGPQDRGRVCEAWLISKLYGYEKCQTLHSEAPYGHNELRRGILSAFRPVCPHCAQTFIYLTLALHFLQNSTPF